MGLVRELGATPIDYQREDFTRVLPGGFDVIFDGIGEDGYRRSFTALKRRGLLCAYGYTAGVQAQRRMFTILMWLARLYLSRWLPGAKRACLYSINLMRKRHPKWFREDLEHLFGLLATHAIRPRVAERISFEEVVEAHRRLEAGGVDGKLVLCPPLSLRDVRDKSLALNDRRRRREIDPKNRTSNASRVILTTSLCSMKEPTF
jgi:NADPH2:quinone reductase